MVRRAGAAEAAARVQDGGVGQEEADGVVVAGDADGRDGGEGGVDGVPDLGLEGAAVVGEGDAVVLPAGDEDLARREHDSVGEDSGEGHGVDGLDGGGAHCVVDRDDAGVCGRAGVLLRNMSAREFCGGSEGSEADIHSRMRHLLRESSLPLRRT